MKKLPRKAVSLVIFIGVIISVLSFADNYLKRSNKQYEMLELDEGWNVDINGEYAKNVTLSKLSFPVTNKGEVLTFSRILPEKCISHPILEFRVYHCIVNVYVDGEEIYNYGESLAAQKEAVGSGKYVIILPENYMGRKLDVKLTVDEDNAFPNVETMYIKNEINYVSYEVCNKSSELVAGIFLIDLGILSIIIIMFIGKYTKEYRKLLWFGIISLSSGSWVLSNYNMAQLFIENRNTITYYEYLGLYIAVPATILFYFESSKSLRARKILIIFLTYDLIFNAIALVTNELNIYHFSVFLTYFHIYAGVVTAFALVYLFYGYKQKAKSEKILTTGILFFISIAGIEIIKFNLMKYIFGGEKFVNLLPVAIITFIIIMIISYLVYLKEYILETTKQKVIIEMAYKDMMTGIANRAKCEKYMQEIAKKNEKEFAIINFDLNYLKKINDTLGHMRGDSYICQFTDILNKEFGDIGFIGRMGGDEFIAIITKNKKYDIVKRIMNMVQEASNGREKEKGEFEISFAYGYAISSIEKTLSVNDVYELADERMYECKKKQKVKRCEE